MNDQNTPNGAENQPGAYGAPQGYGAPQAQPGPYDAPQGYGTPQAQPGPYDAPQGYGAPQAQPGPYDAPQGYGAPQAQPGPYGAPQGYGVPQNQPGPYGAPQGYGAPQNQPGPYGAPQGYGVPQNQPGPYGPTVDRRRARPFRQNAGSAGAPGTAETTKTPRQLTEVKFENARKNLLAVVLFTLINVVLTVLNMDISFLFSASLPLFMAALGRELSLLNGSSNLLLVGAGAAIVMIGLYFGCYLLSKRFRVFMLISLILFAIDTVFLGWVMMQGMEATFIIDILFQIWVLYYLIVGTISWLKLRKMPPDDPLPGQMPYYFPPTPGM